MWRGIRLTFYAVSGIILGGLGFEAATLPRVSALTEQNPATTSMIETRNLEFRAKGAEPRRVQIWVPLEKISPQLQRAVLAGEDKNFATHHGFDYEAIQRAYEQAQKEADREAKQEGDNDSWLPNMPDFKRGASTISQSHHYLLYGAKPLKASHSGTLFERD